MGLGTTTLHLRDVREPLSEMPLFNVPAAFWCLEEVPFGKPSSSWTRGARYQLSSGAWKKCFVPMPFLSAYELVPNEGFLSHRCHSPLHCWLQGPWSKSCHFLHLRNLQWHSSFLSGDAVCGRVHLTVDGPEGELRHSQRSLDVSSHLLRHRLLLVRLLLVWSESTDCTGLTGTGTFFARYVFSFSLGFQFFIWKHLQLDTSREGGQRPSASSWTKIEGTHTGFLFRGVWFRHKVTSSRIHPHMRFCFVQTQNTPSTRHMSRFLPPDALSPKLLQSVLIG